MKRVELPLTSTSPQRLLVCNGHLSFGEQCIHWLLFKPLYNGHFLLSPRWPLWTGSTVIHFFCFRVIFNWVSKVIRDCIGFALLCSVSGLENSRHLLSQSDTKLKPITTWLHAFTSISHWLPLIFSFVLIGRCDYFGFGFTTLNRKALY